MKKLLVYLALAGLFVSINLMAQWVFKDSRLDLTEEKLFTLSQGSRNILSELETDVTVDIYYTESVAAELPQIRTYAQRVHEMLDTLARESKSKITVNRIDPMPFSVAEDQAVASGLEGIPTNKGDMLYFGMVASTSEGKREVMPFFGGERDRFLEYDLVRVVSILNQKKRPVVGLVTNLPLDTGPGGLLLAMRGASFPFVAYQELVDTFELKPLARDFDIVPDDVDVLVVAHPAKLKLEAMYALDQFILAGGRAVIFVDPYSEISQIPGPDGTPLKGATDTSDLEQMFAAWGVDLTKDDAGEPVVVADRDAALPVATQNAGRRVFTDFVLWLGLEGGMLNREDSVTASLARLNIASSGAFELREGSPVAMTPLLTVGPNARTMALDKVKLRPDPTDLLGNFQGDGKQYVLAARLNGRVPSAWPDGPPVEIKDKDFSAAEDEKNLLSQELSEMATDQDRKTLAQVGHLSESNGPINVIVMADTDIFDDRFWVQIMNQQGQRVVVPTADNANFIVNAVENLTGSNDLISLRSRSMGIRPFSRIEAMRNEAEDQFLAEERELEDRLNETEQKLAEVRADIGEGELSEEQQQAIEAFRSEIVQTRKDLRTVQRRLREDIEALESRVRLINIALVPFLVSLFAIGLGTIRIRRRKAAQC